VQILRALDHIRTNRFTLATVEQEDMRLPSFARDVPALRARLDHGVGFFVLRGLAFDQMSFDEAQIVAWVISNYLGRVIRQNYGGLRVELLKDQKRSDGDPYRISQTNRYFAFHSDNGVLEPRPPNYIGLTCLRCAKEGGESVLVSSYTLHNELLAHHPELLDVLYGLFQADKPQLQTRAGAEDRPVRYPIFQRQGAEIFMRYNREFLEQGAAKAGVALSAKALAAFEIIDELMQRESLVFRYKLQRGEMLVANNLATLHSRTAYIDDERPGMERQLLRSWMWRRHAHPGVDPAELDLDELG
jgi:Taurine catabolism dioxygenase TauD, TfdA family